MCRDSHWAQPSNPATHGYNIIRCCTGQCLDWNTVQVLDRCRHVAGIAQYRGILNAQVTLGLCPQAYTTTLGI